MTFYYKYKKYLILLGVLIILGLFIYSYFNIEKEEPVISMNETTTIIKEEIYVDVKGNVKKPGVYSFNKGDKIIDAINKAGGLTKNGVTSNINLSKQLTDEMVVYIYSKKDLSTTSITTMPCKCETISVNNCVTTTKVNTQTQTKAPSNEPTLININTAPLNELVNIPGIGESKASLIIEYRTKNLFNNIEDIKNISGIGDALFAKIKDYITV